MNLGILYMLAVSSLSTYGILLAGFSLFSAYLHTKYTQTGHTVRSFYTPWVFPSLHIKYESGQGYLSNISKPIFLVTKRRVNSNSYLSQSFNTSFSFTTLEVPALHKSLTLAPKEDVLFTLFKTRTIAITAIIKSISKIFSKIELLQLYLWIET